MLDSHVRLDVFKKLGQTEVVCLVATEDEAFTYNRRISRLATIQEKMILTAIEKGVSEERIARALHVNASSIRQKKNLLDGICPEAVELFKDKHVPINTLVQFKKMKPLRQVEATQLMAAMNKYTIAYVRSLVAATPGAMLVRPKKPIRGLTVDQIALMENEAASLDREFKAIEHDFGTDHLDLVLTTGYLIRLLSNARVVGYLAQKFPDILAEFQKISELRKAA